MKNLAAQIDFLEAQLAKAKEERRISKLYKTKFIVKKAKQAQEPQNVEEIQAQLEKLKHELASRKVFACIKHMSRNVKQFKSSEPQKIKKRIKSAPEKKETLEKELALVEGMDVEKWAEYVARAQLSKRFSALVSFEKRTMGPEENNVYARLCKLASVKESIESTVKTISQWVEAEVLGGKGELEPKEAAQLKDKSEGEVETKGKQAGDSKTKSEVEKESKSQASEQSPASPIEASPDFSDSESDVPMEDDFFVTQSGGALPQLTSGYISGSEDESEPEVVKPQRKNRRGQRARRAIWEKRYGAAAKHVVKERKEQEAVEQAKKRKREFKIQKQTQRIERQKALEAKPLHPSWEAKKRQEQLKSAKPAGKKIVFD